MSTFAFLLLAFPLYLAAQSSNRLAAYIALAGSGSQASPPPATQAGAPAPAAASNSSASSGMSTMAMIEGLIQ